MRKLRKLDDVMPAVDFDFRHSKYLDPRITFTRASFAPAIDPAAGYGTAGGQLNMFNVNVPRLTDQGLLIEEATTNYLLNSATLVTQTVAIPSSGRWVLSFYGTGTVVVSGANTGTLTGTGSNERVSLILAGTAVANMTLTVTGTVTYAQLEPNKMTSYIPTTTATVTRAADTAEITGTNFSSWYNQSESSFTASVTRPIRADGRVLFTTPSRNFDFYFAANPLGVGGIYQHNAGSAYQSPTATVTTKFGASLSTNGASKAVNGSGLTNTNSVNLVDVSSLVIGKGFGQLLNGYLSRIAYYPTRVSDSALQGATQSGGIRKL